MMIKRKITPDYVPKVGDVLIIDDERVEIRDAKISYTSRLGLVINPAAFTHYEREDGVDKRFTKGAMWKEKEYEYINIITEVVGAHTYRTCGIYMSYGGESSWGKNDLEESFTYIGHIDDLGEK